MCKDLHNRVTLAPQPLATEFYFLTIRAIERKRSTTIREENWHAFGKHHAGKSDSWATDFGNQASNVVIENHSRCFLKLGNQMQSVPVDVRVKSQPHAQGEDNDKHYWRSSRCWQGESGTEAGFKQISTRNISTKVSNEVFR